MFRITTVALIAVPAFGFFAPAQTTARTIAQTATQRTAQTGPAKPARAAVPQSAVATAQTCSLANSALDDRIAACTRTLNAATASKRELSLAAAYRGNAFRGKGDATRALADYDEAVRLDPANSVALNFRGLELYGRGDIDRAVADFNEAIRTDPNDPAPLTNRGLVYESQNDIARALADFNAALARAARDNAGAAARDVARQRLTALVTPHSAPASTAPVPASPVDIKPIVPPRAGAALAITALLPPVSAVLDGTRLPAPPSANGVAIPGLIAKPPGGVAPVLVPGETTAPDVNGLADARVTSLPNPPPSSHIPPLAPERTDTAAVNATLAPPRPATAAPASNVAPAATAVPARASVAATSATQAAVAANRIALVIGNSTYLTLHYVPNPLNDAADMANALKQLGFTVTLGLDLRRTDMDDMLARFAGQARMAETALVYYSGHGLAHMGENYLLPIDARVKDEADLARLIKLKDVIDDIAGAKRSRIVIIDASRDNEVGQQVAVTLPAGRAAEFGRGLAKLTDSAGTLVVSAAPPNAVVADGKGRNSPFTQALLKRVQQTPDMAVKALMNAVRDDVMRASGGVQRPDIADGLAETFVFKAGR